MLKKIALFLLLLFNLLPETALANPSDYVVLGVIASNNGREGVALMKQKETGKVTAFREGATLSKDLSIARIERKEVLFNFKGSFYILSVGSDRPVPTSGAKPAPSRGGRSVDVDSNNLAEKDGFELRDNTLKVNSTLKNVLVEKKLGEILMQTATEPHVENGRMVGFKLWDIEKGSIFDVAGFQDGDLITAINQQPINSAAIAIRILNQLRNASDAEIEFVRQGQHRNLRIVIQ